MCCVSGAASTRGIRCVGSPASSFGSPLSGFGSLPSGFDSPPSGVRVRGANPGVRAGIAWTSGETGRVEARNGLLGYSVGEVVGDPLYSRAVSGGSPIDVPSFRTPSSGIDSFGPSVTTHSPVRLAAKAGWSLVLRRRARAPRVTSAEQWAQLAVHSTSGGSTRAVRGWPLALVRPIRARSVPEAMPASNTSCGMPDSISFERQYIV